MEGGLAIAGATTFIPFAGWTAAAIALSGAAMIAGGLYLHAKANERVHNPIELWTSRSVFGTRLNDGESRPGLTLDFDKKLPSFASIQSEINAWYATFYSPCLLSHKETSQFDLGQLDSKWTETGTWAIPNWTAITHNEVLGNASFTEFTVLLRGFLLGRSEWQASLSSKTASDNIAMLPAIPDCYAIKGGLILNFKNEIQSHNHVTLQITYQPNLGLDEQAISYSTFTLEK